ncbi:MAG: hypothetical protein M1548_08370 [Actinobacteria bacterium]|nr:hypothetical protein [Actinomycetota bacterium]
MRKRFFLAIMLAFISLIALAGPAEANFAIHGNFVADTDSCAGCHRAHTATSPITWADPWGGRSTRSALLLSTATTVQQFCNTCHGTDAPGASTNIVDGIFDTTSSRPTESVVGAVLNGGGFSDVGRGNPSTSTHMVDGSAGTAWGAGTTGPGVPMSLDCSTCHDVHGTSNYRLLKDVVNGHRVGGYGGNPAVDIDPPPQPFVTSNEVGYPQGGFRLHEPYPGYLPNYTTARYGRPPGGDPTKGITGWCIACHEVYAKKSSPYDAGDGGGGGVRHRHPVNVPLSNWYVGGDPTRPAGDRVLIVDQTAWQRAYGDRVPFVDLPLEHDGSSESGPLSSGSQVNGIGDYIGCLTCHRAHGTAAKMSGYANVADSMNPSPNTGSGGVPPAKDSALLRADNRGVCERCHNK